MKWSLRKAVAFAVMSTLSFAAFGQAGGGHTLFGDFKVEEGQSEGAVPQTFHIILYRTTGQVIGREAVANNSRYRFLNVPNGEYYLVVEMENSEVVKMNVRLADAVKTDIRQDIVLEWRARHPKGTPASAVSAVAYYKRNPVNQTRFDQAMEASNKKDLVTAISLLEGVLAVDPKDFVAWSELGTLHFRRNDLEESEKCYQKAVEALPTFLLALLNLGRLHMLKKNYDAAIENLGRAVQVEPRSSQANFFLGEAYLQIKKGSKAVGYLYEAIKLDPMGMAEAHLRLAALYNGAGLKDRAAQEYQQFLTKKPDYPKRKELERYIVENTKK